LHQVGTSSSFSYMTHGHTYIKYSKLVKIKAKMWGELTWKVVTLLPAEWVRHNNTSMQHLALSHCWQWHVTQQYTQNTLLIFITTMVTPTEHNVNLHIHYVYFFFRWLIPVVFFFTITSTRIWQLYKSNTTTGWA